MNDEVTFNLPPTSFSSEGGASGGNGAPVNDSPQDGEGQREVAQAPVLSASQQKSAAIVTEIRAKAARETLTDKDWRRLSEHSKYRDGLPGAQEPLENRLTPEPDLRPASGLRDQLEKETQAIDREQVERLRVRASVQGVPGDLADVALSTCQALGLDSVASDTIMAQVAKHCGKGFAGEAGFTPLDAEQQADFVAEASRLMGGRDKLEAASLQARNYLEKRGLLDTLHKAGVTASSLSLDPRVILAIKFAADRAGVK